MIRLLVVLRGICAVLALARINKPVPPSDPLISDTIRHRIRAAYWSDLVQPPLDREHRQLL